MEAVSRRPRAVCIVTDDFYPPSPGGAQFVAHDLAQQFGVYGWQALVLTRQTEPPAASEEHIGTIHIRRLPPAGLFKGKGPKAIWPLLQHVCLLTAALLAYARQYDVVLVLGSKILPLPVAVASFVARKPWFVRLETPYEMYEDITDASLRRMPWLIARLLVLSWRTIRLAMLRRATGCIALSREMSAGLKRLGLDPHKIILIPNPIDTHAYAPVAPIEKLALRRKFSLPEEKLIFIYTGRLVTSKGLPKLLEAWADLVKAYADVHLVLVGSGRGSLDDCETELRVYVDEHGLQSRVTMVGKVDAVVEYLQAADVFVSPSYFEAFGLALAEALATQLPVVATRVGAADELVVDGVSGLLVKPRDPNALKTAIEWMITHRERLPGMGIRARVAVANVCSLDNVATQYVKLFAQARSRLLCPQATHPHSHARA